VGRSLLRGQDGDLWVEESRSGGAAFVISLPAAPALRVLAGNAEGTGDGTAGGTSDADPVAIQEAR
jgi:hypothetical protein